MLRIRPRLQRKGQEIQVIGSLRLHSGCCSEAQTMLVNYIYHHIRPVISNAGLPDSM